MKVLVISDIHAMSKDAEYSGEHTGSGFYAENRVALNNPILAIPNTIKEEHDDIDALICLGDLAHQAKKLTFLAVWNDIQIVAEQLEITSVIGITGNHDVDSRAETVEGVDDRINFLKDASSTFPSKNPGFNSSYFEKGYAEYLDKDYQIIAIDTCRLHGLGTTSAAEVYSKGHISLKMIEEVKGLITASNKEICLVAMHHHPQKVNEIVDKEYDQIENGPEFLAMLGGIEKATMVLHGHKHIAGLRQAAIGVRPPWVLSASSLAAYPYRDQELFFTNQFHVLDLNATSSSELDGVAYSWERTKNEWVRSFKPQLPRRQRFGLSPDVRDIESKLVAFSSNEFVTLEHLLELAPEIDYLTKSQIEGLNTQLAKWGKSLVDRNGLLFGMTCSEIRDV